MTFTSADLDDLDHLDALLDALQARQRARAEARPVLNAAGEDITTQAATGRLIVSPGDTIASLWGNTTYDQTMQVFLNNLDRDTQWPTPHDGAQCYTTDTGTAWLRQAGVWVSTSRRLALIAKRSAAFTFPSTANTWVIVPVDQEIADQDNAYTSGLYTCHASGLYLVSGQVSMNFGATTGQASCAIYKNAANSRQTTLTVASGYCEPSCTYVETCVAGDTLALWGVSSVASTALVTAMTFLSIAYLGT